MSYEIYDNNNKVTSNNIDDGFTIKLYFDNTLLDSYNVKTEYLKINNLSIKEEEKVIYNVSLGATYNDFVKNIDTSGEITILNKSGNEVSLDSKVKTFDTVNINLSSGDVKYTISVFGDITGSGSVTAGDIAKMYQGVKGKITLDNTSILAGDVTKNGKVEINDVAKAYSYLKGKLSSL